MKVEDSIFKDKYLKKISNESGNFYIFEKFVISKISRGVKFNWEIAKEVIEEVYSFFGTKQIKVSYISNRINSYSLYPQDWLQFYNNKNHLEALAIVTYNKIGLTNILLEKLFVQSTLKKFESLEGAVS